MTKEEKIKEAWGLAYDEVKHLLTDNGYICSVDLAHIRLNLSSYNLYLNYNDIGARPKSLKGIENNNGWIRLESEDDRYPNEDVWISNFNGNGIAFFHDALKLIPKECTHYQPIEKPKPPIY